MEAFGNVVVLRGHVTSDPVVRELPSGTTVTQFDVTTRRDGGRAISVPVAVHDRSVSVTRGDDVVVTGHVARRFFRVGGATQSRTEVIATRVVTSSRRRAVERAISTAVDHLDEMMSK